jgi:hypothetical protein
MHAPSRDLLTMIEAARAAGAGLQRRFAQLSELAVRAKSGPADLVSIADEEAERTAHEMLAAARPHTVFSARRPRPADPATSAQTWIVDPLDGTTNFLFACPLWGVNVALAREGRVVAGVSYLPMLDELYVAEAGQGGVAQRQAHPRVAAGDAGGVAAVVRHPVRGQARPRPVRARDGAPERARVGHTPHRFLRGRHGLGRVRPLGRVLGTRGHGLGHGARRDPGAGSRRARDGATGPSSTCAAGTSASRTARCTTC